MFGYVKPYHPQLLVKDYEFYKASYCGVCRAMKRHTGALSTVTLSYDSVFLALVRMLYVPDEKIAAKKSRCALHPLKSRPMLTENEATEYTARAFAILTYYKMLDDLHDEKLLKRMARRALKPILTHAKKKSKLDTLSDLAAEKLAKITELEDARCKSVDEPAHLFGELLGEIFAFGLSGSDRLVTYSCGYHLGRFIYAIDAAEDYDEDRKSGSYNPYVEIYEGAFLTAQNRESIKCALLLECKKLEGAINLLPFNSRYTIENIIKNIIYDGLVRRMSFLDVDEKEKNDERPL